MMALELLHLGETVLALHGRQSGLSNADCWPCVCLQVSCVTRLVLQDCGCPSLQGLLSHLPSLAVLALPFNKLTSLDGLSTAAGSSSLVELDVSHNLLGSWQSRWLEGCNALTSLDASFNIIAQPADLQALARWEGRTMPDVCTTCPHCCASSVIHPTGSQVQPQSDGLVSV